MKRCARVKGEWEYLAAVGDFDWEMCEKASRQNFGTFVDVGDDPRIS